MFSVIETERRTGSRVPGSGKTEDEINATEAFKEDAKENKIIIGVSS